MRPILVTSIVCLWALPAWGSGLFTPDTGVVALGRAGAFVATANDNTALYYNPAGLYQMDGLQLRGGLLGMSQPTCFSRDGGEGRYKLDSMGAIIGTGGGYDCVENLDNFRPIPEYSLSFGLENPDMTWAIGLYAPLAPWISYPMYGPNRYRLTRLRLIQGNLALGWGWRLPGVMDWLAIGASFQVIYIKMEQDFWATTDLNAEGENNNPEDPQWDVLTEFSAEQYLPSFNVGLMIIPSERVKIGVSFQPPYTFEGDGTVHLSGETGSAYLQQVKDDYSWLLEAAGIDLDTSPLMITGSDEIMVNSKQPAIVRAGVAVQPAKWIDLELDGQVEFWSVADAIVASDIDVPLEHCDEDGCQDLQSELVDRVSTDDGSLDPCEYGLLDCAALGNYKGDDNSGTHTIPQNWGTSFSIRFGGELRPFLAEQRLGFRFGYAFESSAIPDETLSLLMIDNDKHLFGSGISVRFTGFEVHFTYAFILQETRSVGSDVSTGLQTGLEGTAANEIDVGTYCARDHFVGLNVAFDFTSMHRAAKARKVARNDALHF